ncbi:MAG: hypothetical protein V3V35_10530 [Dehalococcoidia bacterium]
MAGVGLVVALVVSACAGVSGGAEAPVPSPSPELSAPSAPATPAYSSGSESLFAVESAAFTSDTPYFDPAGSGGRVADIDPSTAQAAQPFTLPSAQGPTVSLASYHGEKNVVVIFYRGFW